MNTSVLSPASSSEHSPTPSPGPSAVRADRSPGASSHRWGHRTATGQQPELRSWPTHVPRWLHGVYLVIGVVLIVLCPWGAVGEPGGLLFLLASLALSVSVPATSWSPVPGSLMALVAFAVLAAAPQEATIVSTAVLLNAATLHARGVPHAFAWAFTLSQLLVFTVANRGASVVQDALLPWGLLTAVAVLAGTAVRIVRGNADHTRRRAARALTAQRQLMARELHDTSVHDITTMIMRAERARTHTTDPETLADLELIASVGHQAVGELRGLLHMMRLSDGASAWSTALPAVLVPFDELIGRAETELGQAGISLTTHVEADLEELPRQTRINLARILGELFANMGKYAVRGSSATVFIDLVPGHLRCVAINRVDPRALGGRHMRGSTSSRLGLVGIAERASALGGRSSFSEKDGVWMAQVTLPTPSCRAAQTAGRDPHPGRPARPHRRRHRPRPTSCSPTDNNTDRNDRVEPVDVVDSSTSPA